MLHSIKTAKTAAPFSAALLVVTLLGARSHAPRAYADAYQGVAGPAAKRASQVKEPAPDPTKKQAGEPCKSSSECQPHHSCAKVGDKHVCKAPPRPQLPPGAVT